MNNGIKIVSGEVAPATLDALFRILEARADQATIQKALDVLARSVSGGTTFSGCTVTSETHHHHSERDAEEENDDDR